MEFEKEYNCPQCHSNKVEEISGDLLCLECGYSFSQQDEEE